MRMWQLFSILSVLLLILLVVAHEEVHVTINGYDGIDSYISLREFPSIVTIPEENCKTEACEIGHNLNEVVGYQLFPFFVLFLFGFLFILYYLDRVATKLEGIKNNE